MIIKIINEKINVVSLRVVYCFFPDRVYDR